MKDKDEQRKQRNRDAAQKSYQKKKTENVELLKMTSQGEVVQIQLHRQIQRLKSLKSYQERTLLNILCCGAHRRREFSPLARDSAAPTTVVPRDDDSTTTDATPPTITASEDDGNGNFPSDSAKAGPCDSLTLLHKDLVIASSALYSAAGSGSRQTNISSRPPVTSAEATQVEAVKLRDTKTYLWATSQSLKTPALEFPEIDQVIKYVDIDAKASGGNCIWKAEVITPAQKLTERSEVKESQNPLHGPVGSFTTHEVPASIHHMQQFLSSLPPKVPETAIDVFSIFDSFIEQATVGKQETVSDFNAVGISVHDQAERVSLPTCRTENSCMSDCALSHVKRATYGKHDADIQHDSSSDTRRSRYCLPKTRQPNIVEAASERTRLQKAGFGTESNQGQPKDTKAKNKLPKSILTRTTGDNQDVKASAERRCSASVSAHAQQDHTSVVAQALKRPRNAVSPSSFGSSALEFWPLDPDTGVAECSRLSSEQFIFADASTLTASPLAAKNVHEKSVPGNDLARTRSKVSRSAPPARAVVSTVTAAAVIAPPPLDSREKLAMLTPGEEDQTLAVNVTDSQQAIAARIGRGFEPIDREGGTQTCTGKLRSGKELGSPLAASFSWANSTSHTPDETVEVMEVFDLLELAQFDSSLRLMLDADSGFSHSSNDLAFRPILPERDHFDFRVSPVELLSSPPLTDFDGVLWSGAKIHAANSSKMTVSRQDSVGSELKDEGQRQALGKLLHKHKQHRQQEQLQRGLDKSVVHSKLVPSQAACTGRLKRRNQ